MDKNIPQTDHPQTVTEDMMSENGANPDEAAISENAAATNSELNNAIGLDKNGGHFLYTESNNSGIMKY